MRPVESDPPLVVEVDLKASLVDHHLMMKPTEDDQFGLVGLPTLTPRHQMVDLESTS